MIRFREAFLLFLTTSVTGDVQIYPQFGLPHIIADFSDLPARFGEIIPIKGISAYVVYANPDQACSKIDPPPNNVTNLTNRWAVLIKRNNCTFEDKVLAAQNASFDVAIIHNVNSNKLERMHANDPDKIRIPSIFVSASTGRAIKNKYQYFNGFLIQISEDSPMDYNKIFIPFLIVILLCFFTMIGFMVAKCIKDHRRARRRRLPHSSLRQIPITKYRKGDPYETCAICLDDFIEGEKLRILPCSHAYHSKCIDPWLTRNRRVCPMCKRKVFAQNEQISDNDSMSDDDDHTPLLRSAQRTHGGTFSSRENLLIRSAVERNSLPSTSSIEDRTMNADGRSLQSDLINNGCCNGNDHAADSTSCCTSQYCAAVNNEEHHYQQACCCYSQMQQSSSSSFCPVVTTNADIDASSVLTSLMYTNVNNRINDISCDACIGRSNIDDEVTSHDSSENPGN